MSLINTLTVSLTFLLVHSLHDEHLTAQYLRIYCPIAAALAKTNITNTTPPKFPKEEQRCRSARRRRQSTRIEDDHEPCCHVN